MALNIFDNAFVAFGSNPHRSFYDGHLGNVFEDVIYLRNDNAGKYYTAVSASPVFNGMIDAGSFSDTGFSIKFFYGQRQPTEQEWDLVDPGVAVSIPDIGTTLSADTSTFFPIWVRMYVPGGTAADIRTNMSARIFFYEKSLGS